MTAIKEGDWVYTFMGEELINLVVTAYDAEIDPLRLAGEDASNTYCFYAKDCYATKEEAIAGMLKYIREITECDCGEDEQIISHLAGRIPNCS
jgi:hypothetical protein